MDLTTYFAVMLNHHVITKCLDDAKSILECRDKHLEYSEPIPQNAMPWLRVNFSRKAYVIDPEAVKNDFYLADPTTKEVINRNHLGAVQRKFLANLIAMGSPLLLGQYAFGATHILSTTTGDEALTPHSDHKHDDTAGTYYPRHKTAFTESEDYPSFERTDIARHEAAHIVQFMFEKSGNIVTHSFIQELMSMPPEKRLELAEYYEHELAPEEERSETLSQIDDIKRMSLSLDIGRLEHPIDATERGAEEDLLTDYERVALIINDLARASRDKQTLKDGRHYDLSQSFLSRFFPKTKELSKHMDFANEDAILSNNPAFIAAYESDVKRLLTQAAENEVIGNNNIINYALPVALSVSTTSFGPVTINGQLEACFSEQATDKIPQHIKVVLDGTNMLITGGHHGKNQNARYEAFAEIFADLSDITGKSKRKIARNFPCTSKFVQSFVDALNSQWKPSDVNLTIDYSWLQKPIQDIKRASQILPQDLNLGR